MFEVEVTNKFTKNLVLKSGKLNVQLSADRIWSENHKMKNFFVRFHNIQLFSM